MLSPCAPSAGLPCREQGLEALADAALQMPGRYLHLSPDDMRLRDVPDVLADYQLLFASHASIAQLQAAAPAMPPAGVTAGGGTSRPATPA